MAWGPIYPMIGAASIGLLRLPRALYRVRSVEPMLYRWAGVGIAKWLVTSRGWALLVGLEPPKGLVHRQEVLDRAEFLTTGAEISHFGAFLFASLVSVFCLVVGWRSAAAWTLALNVALNGYPILLQRSNRWRLQAIRARSART